MLTVESNADFVPVEKPENRRVCSSELGKKVTVRDLDIFDMT